MPLHLDETLDKITSLTSFQISPLLEMLASLQAFAHPWRVRKWTEEVVSIMGKDFQHDLSELYTVHNMGSDFTEFAIDYADQNDIPGFINYVREMPVNQFIFYLQGRILPLELIPENGDPNEVHQLINSYMDNSDHAELCLIPGNTKDIASIRIKLPELLEDYWMKYFKGQLGHIDTILEESIKEKENFLIRNGGTPLLKKITGKEHLPPLIPDNMPYSSVRYIPIYRMHKTYQIFYGYGNVTILYDSGLTNSRTTELRQLKDSILTTMKALGDENRLKILKMVADAYQNLNGKKIAERLGLSQSVVSRHLGQLKEAGLIKEFSPDKRNITYSIEWEAIGDISSMIQKYMEAESN